MKHVWIRRVIGTCIVELQNGRSCVVRNKVKTPFFRVPPSDFIEIKNRCERVNWELFATTIWGLWNNRNQVRHGGQCKSYEVIVKEAAEYLNEYKVANMCAKHSTIPEPVTWRPPK